MSTRHGASFTERDSWPGVVDRLGLLRRDLLLARPGSNRLGVRTRFAAAMDGGEDDAVTRVVEKREAPTQVPADVAERVVADHGKVAQRVRVLRLEGRHLLPQTVHVLGERIDSHAAGRRLRTSQRQTCQDAGESSEQQGESGKDQHPSTL